MLKKTILLSILVLNVLFLALSFAQDTENTAYSDPVTETYRIKLEEQLEDRLKNRLISLLQDESVFVIVKVRLFGEEVPLSISRPDEDEYALPGVPVEKKLTMKKEEEMQEQERYTRKIANIYTWIFVSRKIPNDVLQKAQELSSEIVGIDTERGDRLTIETYFKETSMWVKIKNMDDVFMLLMLSLFVLAAVGFLFGPLAIFLGRLSKNITTANTQQMIAAQSGAASIGEMGAAQAARHPGQNTQSILGKVQDEGFSFITEDRLDDLAFILATGELQDAIITLNNIPMNYSNRIFSKLPVQIQRNLIEQQKTVNFMEPLTVQAVRDKVRKKLDNIYGGPEKIGHLIQGTTENVRENLLNWLRDNDPSFADKVNSNIIDFSDILKLEDADFRKIFRSAGIPLFAQALKMMDEDEIAAYMAKLNPEVVNLLNEQINIVPASARRAEDAKMSILEIFENLMKNGDIEKEQ